MPRKFIIVFAMLIGCGAFAYNQKVSLSKAPLKNFGLSIGLGMAGNGAGIKAQFAVHQSLALVLPLTVSYLPKITIKDYEISLLRLHAGLGFRWHVGQKIDRSACYVEPVLNMGMTELRDERYFALKPALGLGYSWVWDGGFSFSLGLTGE